MGSSRGFGSTPSHHTPCSDSLSLRLRARTPPPPQRPQAWHDDGLGISPVRSPLLGASRLIPVPRGTEMFQFPRLPRPPYGFRRPYPTITSGGLPHSGLA